MDQNRTGVVSNCWRVQLEAGDPIAKLVEEAVHLGFHYIELRQGCLGDCEDDDDNPIPDRLARLAALFPGVSFNLALQLPVLTHPDSISAAQWSLAVESAQALKGSNRAGHLRLVDLASPIMDTGRGESTQRSLVELAESLSGGTLSIENSIQPWDEFRSMFERMRECVPDLKLCYDPCNLWMTGDGERAATITQSIPIEWYSMVHFKQRLGNEVLPTLTEGDVDLEAQASILTDVGYHGPLLLETSATGNVLAAFEQSVRWLQAH